MHVFPRYGVTKTPEIWPGRQSFSVPNFGETSATKLRKLRHVIISRHCAFLPRQSRRKAAGAHGTATRTETIGASQTVRPTVPAKIPYFPRAWQLRSSTRIWTGWPSNILKNKLCVTLWSSSQSIPEWSTTPAMTNTAIQQAGIPSIRISISLKGSSVSEPLICSSVCSSLHSIHVANNSLVLKLLISYCSYYKRHRSVNKFCCAFFPLPVSWYFANTFLLQYLICPILSAVLSEWRRKLYQKVIRLVHICLLQASIVTAQWSSW